MEAIEWIFSEIGGQMGWKKNKKKMRLMERKEKWNEPIMKGNGHGYVVDIDYVVWREEVKFLVEQKDREHTQGHFAIMPFHNWKISLNSENILINDLTFSSMLLTRFNQLLSASI